MIKRRMYVGRLLDADNELDAITRRQTIHVVEDAPLELPPIPHDWRYGAAAVCGIIVSIGFVAALVMAMVASR